MTSIQNYNNTMYLQVFRYYINSYIAMNFIVVIISSELFFSNLNFFKLLFIRKVN